MQLKKDNSNSKKQTRCAYKLIIEKSGINLSKKMIVFDPRII